MKTTYPDIQIPFKEWEQYIREQSATVRINRMVNEFKHQQDGSRKTDSSIQGTSIYNKGN